MLADARPLRSDAPPPSPLGLLESEHGIPSRCCGRSQATKAALRQVHEERTKPGRSRTGCVEALLARGNASHRDDAADEPEQVRQARLLALLDVEVLRVVPRASKQAVEHLNFAFLCGVCAIAHEISPGTTRIGFRCRILRKADALRHPSLGWPVLHSNSLIGCIGFIAVDPDDSPVSAAVRR